MRGLAQRLVQAGAVEAEAMSAAVSRFGETPELQRHLVSQRLVTETQIAQAIAAQTGFDFHDLTDAQLDPNVVGCSPARCAASTRRSRSSAGRVSGCRCPGGRSATSLFRRSRTP